MTDKAKERMDSVMETLDKGVKEVFESGRYEEWLRCLSQFHSYSARNTLLIMMQDPDATHVAGFNTWQKKFGRFVKKGEKAIWILAPTTHKKEVEDEDGETKTIVWNSYRPVPVFDVKQTEGKELPEIARDLEGDVAGYSELVEKLMDVSPVPVEFEEIQGGSHGYCSHADGRIAVKKGMSEAQTVKTMVHEIAHAMLHGSGGEETGADKNTKEVQAESVAYAACSRLGIDSSEYSFGYVAAWAKGKDAKELSESMTVIQKTANAILEAVEKRAAAKAA